MVCYNTGMDTDAFIKVITETIDSLPEEFRTKLVNVDITVEDDPTEEQRVKLQLSPYTSLFGLFEGVPQNVPGEDRSYVPDKITIFRNPILRHFQTDEERREQIKNTVLHEIGHYFGMSEDQLHKLNNVS
jgi:predicted Zn-dependent protease with MMP-like domain